MCGRCLDYLTAETYDKGRVYLLGDSAHASMPTRDRGADGLGRCLCRVGFVVRGGGEGAD